MSVNIKTESHKSISDLKSVKELYDESVYSNRKEWNRI